MLGKRRGIVCHVTRPDIEAKPDAEYTRGGISRLDTVGSNRVNMPLGACMRCLTSCANMFCSVKLRPRAPTGVPPGAHGSRPTLYVARNRRKNAPQSEPVGKTRQKRERRKWKALGTSECTWKRHPPHLEKALNGRVRIEQ